VGRGASHENIGTPSPEWSEKDMASATSCQPMGSEARASAASLLTSRTDRISLSTPTQEGEYVLLGPVSDAVDRDEEEEEEEAQEGWEEEEEGLWNEGRVAYTVSFFVDGATTLPSMERVHDEDADSYTEWLGDVGLGALARHAHLPVVVERCGLSS
jgi:hypothetical protein